MDIYEQKCNRNWVFPYGESGAETCRMFSSLWNNVVPKEVLLLSGDVFPWKAQAHSTLQDPDRRRSRGGLFQASVSLPCFWLAASLWFLTRLITLTSQKFFMLKIIQWEIEKSPLEYMKPQSTNILSHGGSMHVPLSFEWSKGHCFVYQCGHDVPVCVSPALPSLHTYMYLLPVAQKRLLPTVMITHLFPGYKPCKLEFQRNPPLKMYVLQCYSQENILHSVSRNWVFS